MNVRAPIGRTFDGGSGATGRGRLAFIVPSAILLLPLLTPLLHADVNVGDHPQLQFNNAFGNHAVDLQALAGKMVVVDFWASWCGPCMEEAPHIVQLNQKYAPLGMQMIGISLDDDRSAMQGVVKDKGFNWPQYFDGAGWDNRFAKAWGVSSIPQTFIISPTGEVLWRGHPAEIDGPLAKAMKNHPPELVDPQTAALAAVTLEKVESATAASHFAEAIKMLGDFPPAARADPKIAERADKDSKELNSAAETILNQADALASTQKYTEAAEQLQGLITSMAGTDVGKHAQESLNSLRANPAAASAIAASAREHAASAALLMAQKLQAAKRDRQAYISFKSVMKEYAGTAAAASAADAVNAYEADPAFAKQQAAATAVDASEKARSALSMAMNYLNAGRTDTAREKFQDVIDRFPGTPQADAAQDELAKLAGS
jgi:thiol-disulfide isomerase/thioredoxin